MSTQSDLPLAEFPPRRCARGIGGLGVTLRSALLGLVGVAFICGFTPFNNFVANNTFLVGNLLPVGVLLYLGVAVFVNGMLWRFRPTAALSRQELTVALAMVLVSATLPSSGLMRYLPTNLVGLYNAAGSDFPTARLLENAPLASWVFPDFQRETPEDRSFEPVIADFLSRTPEREPGLLGMIYAVPWGKWAAPAIAWGVFLAFFYGAVLFLMSILRRQWVENERLAFPLAEVLTSLLEPPQRGSVFPPSLAVRSFWIAGAIVFGIHMLNGLNQYDPRWPAVPLGYNLSGLLSEQPWVFTTYGFKAVKLMFIVVGITFFIQSKVAFSLVFFFLAFNAVQVLTTANYGGIEVAMQRDQTAGAVVVFTCVILYTGRHHWLDVARRMIGLRGQGPGDPYLPYPVSAWGLVLCVAGAWTWLTLAGSPWLNAGLIVLALLTFHLVLARIVADTGLIYTQIHAQMQRPWFLLGTLGARTTPSGYLLMGMTTSILAHDIRESSAAYASTSLATADRNDLPATRRAWVLIPLIGLALIVGFVIAGASTLVCHYNFASTLDRSGIAPINPYGVAGSVQTQIVQPVNNLLSPGGIPSEPHNRWLQVGIGAVMMLLVSGLHLRFTGFPFHPVAVVMMYAFSLQHIWLSVMVGWLAKSLVLRLGGASLYRSAKPFFLGLIFGESAAIAAWLIINLVLLGGGYPYQPINLLLP